MNRRVPRLVGAIALIVALVGAVRVADTVRTRRTAQTVLAERAQSADGELTAAFALADGFVDEALSSAVFLAATPPPRAIVRAAQNDGVDPVSGDSSADWAQRLEDIFVAFAATHDDVRQVRLIAVGPQGKELVRVDRGADGTIVPIGGDDLQVKGDRPYIMAAISAGASPYVSPYQLNVERTVLSIPYQATIRSAMTLFDEAGTPSAVLVVNYDATGLLSSFDELDALEASDSEVILAGPDGRFLLTGEPVDTLLPNRRSPLGRFTAAKRPSWSGAALPAGFDVVTIEGQAFLRGPSTSHVLGSTRQPTVWSIEVATPIEVIDDAIGKANGQRRWRDSALSLLAVALVGSFGLVATRRRSHRERQALQDAVDARTVALAEALGEAEQANRHKSEFVATMSHELRTPLNALIGVTELLQHSSLDERQARFVELMHASSEHLLAIVNDVLDLGRIEAGVVELAEGPVDVAALVESAASVASVPARANGVDLRVQISPELPTDLLGDADRVGQVLLNLAANAVKFTSDGTVTIAAELARLDHQAPEIRFTVSDTGIGIAPADLERIFEPFTQVDAGASRSREGSGLGLAICRRLVELMGGTIDIVSQPGEGTTVTVLIPFAVGQPPTIEPPLAPVALPDRRVLVIEDNETNRTVIDAMLTRLGAEVVLASSAGEGLHLLDTDRAFDVVLLDVRMPHMDGLQCCRAIRSSEATSGMEPLHVVALTANSTDEDRKRCLEAGMDDFLTKPVRLAQLEALIHRLPSPVPSV